MLLVSDVTLADCVLRAQEGDAEAFGLLYDRLAPDVARFLRGVSRQLTGAALEDAVQETFLRLLDRLGKLSAPGSVRAYTLGVARHVALDQLRRGKAREAREAAVGERRAGQVAPAEARLERAELSRLSREVLETLEPELRLVLSLRHVSGLTMQDLAVALSCSVPTARARLRTAVRQLAAGLRERGLDPQEVIG